MSTPPSCISVLLVDDLCVGEGQSEDIEGHIPFILGGTLLILLSPRFIVPAHTHVVIVDLLRVLRVTYRCLDLEIEALRVVIIPKLTIKPPTIAR